MDLFSKGVKFLQELDEPAPQGKQSNDLETSLDGVAERLLGWATGPAGASKSSESPASPASPADRVRPVDDDCDDDDLAVAASHEMEHEELEELQQIPNGSSADQQAFEAAPDSSSRDCDTTTFEFGTVHAQLNRIAPVPAVSWSVRSQRTYPGEDKLDEDASEISDKARGDCQTNLQELDQDEEPQGGNAEIPIAMSTSHLATTQEQVEAPSATAPQASPPGELVASSHELHTCASGEGERELRAELEDCKGQLLQRERQLADLSNALAEMEARDTNTREQAQARRSKAIEAVRASEKEVSATKRRAEKAEAATEEWKEKAAAAEKRLKQEARDMEQELHKAQDTWKERIKKAELRVQEVEKESKEAAAANAADLKEAHDMVAKLKTRLRAQAAGSEETRGELEGIKAKAEDAEKRLNERLRSAAETELQLRGELKVMEQSRFEMQERIAELSGQLERAEQAYSEAAREVGTMSLRLNELEFGAKADSGAEDVLRQELTMAKERCAELEQRLTDCTGLRDRALQQAEDAIARAQRAEEEAAQARAERAERPVSPAGSAGKRATAEEADSSQPRDEDATAEEAKAFSAEVAALQQQIQKLAEQHRADLKSQAEETREEISYLKRKNDEKDKRLEILTCERNALRYEQSGGDASSSKPSRVAVKDASDASLGAAGKQLVDLEDGLSLKEVLSGAAPLHGGSGGAFKACLADADLVLRRFSRLLFASPTTRRLFYGYVLLLHIWIWVVLHRAAAVHATHTSSAHAKQMLPGAVKVLN